MSVRMDASLYSEVARIEKGDFLRFHCEQLSHLQRDVQRYFFGVYYPRWHAMYMEEVREIIGNLGYTQLRHFPAFPLDVYRREDGQTYVTDDFVVDNVLVIGQPQNQRDDDMKRFKIVSVDDTTLRTKTSGPGAGLPAVKKDNKGSSMLMATSTSEGVGAVYESVELGDDVVQILTELRDAYVMHAGGGIPEIGIKAMGRHFRKPAADGRRWMTLQGLQKLVRDSRAFGLPQPSSLALTQRSKELIRSIAETIYNAFPHGGDESLVEEDTLTASMPGGCISCGGDNSGVNHSGTVTKGTFSGTSFCSSVAAVPATGGIDYDVFMDFVRGHMNAARKKAVWNVFVKLDFDNDGLLAIHDIQARFNAQEHPVVVRDGFFSAEGLLKGFLVLWDENNKQYGMVSYCEFLDYYNGLSAVIDDDDVFLSIVKTTWKMPPFAQTSMDHRMLTRFEDRRGRVGV